MLYYLTPLLIYIPVGIYLFFVFKRFLGLVPFFKKENKISKILSIVLVLFCVAKGWRVYGLGAVLVLHFFVISLVMEGINVLCKKCMRSKKQKMIWNFLYCSGIPSILILLFMMGYGYFNIKNVQKTEYHLTTTKQLSKELTIVQISDLHTGTTMDIQKLSTYCDQIAKEQPDILALTGDIFDERTSKQDMINTIKTIANIPITYGIYYVFGNHDYNYYTRTPYYTAEELRSILEKNQIIVLEDEFLNINNELAIVGRKDASVQRKTIQELLYDFDHIPFLILLDHQPRKLKENADAGVDLQLSGHTHAGQIWPTGQLGQLFGVTEWNYGLKKIGDFQAIVSSGIAGWGYPIRTGGHSEYVVITVNVF